MLVWRHGLLRNLPANPIRFLREDHAQSVPDRSHCRSTSADPASNDDQVRVEFLRAGSLLGKARGRKGFDSTDNG
jgi:hypothetical protein